MRHAKALLRLLMPTPLDAWTFGTLVFGLLALVGSIYWYADLPYLDPIELPMPLLFASIAMAAGFCLAAVVGTVERKIVVVYLLTNCFGAAVFFFAGRWLNVHEVIHIYLDNQEQGHAELSLPAFWTNYRWHLCALVGMLLLMTVLSFVSRHHRWIENGNGLILNGLPRLGSYLNRHRKRLMIGFAVIMFPATVLRNAIDTELRSQAYVIGFFTFLLIAIVVVAAFYLLARLFFNRNWLAFKALWLIGLAIAGSAYWLMQALSPPIRYNFLDGSVEAIAWAVTPVFVTIAFLVPLWSVGSRDGSNRHLVSVWSLVGSVTLLGCIGFFWQRYDTLTVASGVVESVSVNRKPPPWAIMSTAQESRRIQKLTGGAARVLPNFGSLLHYVRFRGEQDADCLQLLLDSCPRGIESMAIENLQPYVDTKPLRNFSGHVGILSGKITSGQMEDLCERVKSVAFCDAELPQRNENGVTLPPRVTTYSDKPIPGLAGFIDAYTGSRKGPFYLNAPMTMDDWEAVVRANQRCQFHCFNWYHLPAKAAESPEIANQASLSGITLSYVYLTELYGDPVRMLKTDLNFQRVNVADEQMLWDVAFSNPAITRGQPDAQSEAIPFLRAMKQYHWAYGWNDNDQITHLWLPHIDQLDKNASELGAVKTLRFDRRGYIGFRAMQALDFSPLGKLPQLERLYLGSGEYFGDLRFLAKLPLLVHLQIQAQDRKGMKTTGYEVCTNLQSIRFFGTPQQSAIKELAGLSKLERVEIVDDESSFDDEPKIEALEKQLPGVEIRILSPDDFQPDLSDRLQDHLQSVRKAIAENHQ